MNKQKRSKVVSRIIHVIPKERKKTYSKVESRKISSKIHHKSTKMLPLSEKTPLIQLKITLSHTRHRMLIAKQVSLRH